MYILTKIQPPQLPATYLQRPVLVEQMLAAAQIMVVQAPAGYGKTLALRALYAALQAQGQQVGWLTLDQFDRDAARLWSYIALVLFPAESEAHTQPGLAQLQERLAQLEQPITLILDQVEQLQDAAVLGELEQLLMYPPRSLRVVLATRQRLPFPLTRWRLNQQASVLGTAELRFTSEECRRWCVQVGLAEKQTQAFIEMMQGWPAGLELARIQLAQSHQVAAETVLQQQHLLDQYLIEEVFEPQSAAVQELIGATALVEQFNRELAQALVEQADFSSTWQAIQQGQLFLIGFESGWLAYQTLFRHAVQRHMVQTRPDVARHVWQQASRWFAAHEQPELAVHYALQAQAWTWAAHLIEQYGGPLMVQGRIATLHTWIHTLPSLNSPRLRLLKLWIQILQGDLYMVAPQLDQLEQELADDHDPTLQELRGQVATLRGQVAALQGDLVLAITQNQRALEMLPAEALLMRGILGTTLGSLQALAGSYAEAHISLLAARQACELTKNEPTRYVAQALLGQIALEQADLTQAASYFAEVVAWNQPHAIVGSALVGLGTIDVLRNQPEQAMQSALQAETRAGTLPDQLAPVMVLQAAAALLVGDSIQAKQKLAQLSAVLQHVQQPLLRSLLATQQAHSYLLLDQPAMVARWAEEYHQQRATAFTTPQVGWNELTLLWYQWQHTQHAELEQLAPLIEHTAKHNWRLLHIHSLVLGSIIACATAQHQHAHTWLSAALEQIEQHQLPGLLLTYGERLLPALQRYAGPHSEAAQALITAQTTTSTVELTPREQDVLKLLAHGHSTKAIATALVISPGTVRTHLINLYGKLQVNSRTAAVARARELGLLN